MASVCRTLQNHPIVQQNKRKFEDTSSCDLPLSTPSLLDSGLYSDLIIRTATKDIKVHRSVVCVQSAPMTAILRNESKEAKTGVVDLSKDEPDHIDLMIKYLYTGKIELPTTPPKTPSTSADPKTPKRTLKEPRFVTSKAICGLDDLDVVLTGIKDNGSSKHPKAIQLLSRGSGLLERMRSGSPQFQISARNLLLSTHLYILGDYWQIEGLKKAAAASYSQLLSTDWNSDEFVQSLQLIFQHLTAKENPLVDMALGCAGVNMSALLLRGGFEAACKDDPDMMYELLRASAA